MLSIVWLGEFYLKKIFTRIPCICTWEKNKEWVERGREWKKKEKKGKSENKRQKDEVLTRAISKTAHFTVWDSIWKKNLFTNAENLHIDTVCFVRHLNIKEETKKVSKSEKIHSRISYCDDDMPNLQ